MWLRKYREDQGQKSRRAVSERLEEASGCWLNHDGEVNTASPTAEIDTHRGCEASTFTTPRRYTDRASVLPIELVGPQYFAVLLPTRNHEKPRHRPLSKRERCR